MKAVITILVLVIAIAGTVGLLTLCHMLDIALTKPVKPKVKEPNLQVKMNAFGWEATCPRCGAKRHMAATREMAIYDITQHMQDCKPAKDDFEEAPPEPEPEPEEDTPETPTPPATWPQYHGKQETPPAPDLGFTLAKPKVKKQPKPYTESMSFIACQACAQTFRGETARVETEHNKHFYDKHVSPTQDVEVIEQKTMDGRIVLTHVNVSPFTEFTLSSGAIRYAYTCQTCFRHWTGKTEADAWAASDNHDCKDAHGTQDRTSGRLARGHCVGSQCDCDLCAERD